MDVFAEVYRLPYYLYVFEERVMIIGGQTSPPNEAPFNRVFGLWEDIKTLYQKGDLSDEEKVLYAKYVQKMARWSARKSLSKSELEEKISSLNKKEQEDIKWQIEMYKLGREFYRDYVHGK